MEKNHRVRFEFKDNTKITFDFSKPENDVDVKEIADHIIAALARRKKLVKGEFGKLIKKSHIISHRKVVMGFYINEQLIKTELTDIEISNKICTNAAALGEAITILFTDL